MGDRRQAAVRTGALATLVLLLAFFGLRTLAAGCEGAGCDLFIPFSALLPLAALAAAVATGLAAVRSAWGSRARAGDAAWPWLLAVCTVLSGIGPPVSLAVWRDSPDTLVPVAAVLLLLSPVSALAYTFSRPRRP